VAVPPRVYHIDNNLPEICLKKQAEEPAMQTLARTFGDYPIELIRVIANRWDIDLSNKTAKKAADDLASAMLNPAKVNTTWEKLPEDQRGALQTLLGAGGKMPAPFFFRTYGEIRSAGGEKIAREKLHLNPAGVSEMLYYRGLVALGFAESKNAGKPQQIVYIPSDLAALLPKHLTSYAMQPEPDAAVAPLPTVPTVADPANARLAETSLVDDITTLLAACQVEDIVLENNVLIEEYRKTLREYFIGTGSLTRFALMTALIMDMGLASISAEGFLKPNGAAARAWLDQPRPSQVRALAEAWRKSQRFNELWFVPSLKPEKVANDPALARDVILNFLDIVPANTWWEVEELIAGVREQEPDFQRPDGNYDSWYIRDAENKYLKGFASWDKVEGALLRFILTGVMHGLGLVDITSDTQQCRLTAYGRGLIGAINFPSGGPENAPFVIHADGTCDVPRAASRFERFQLARFTEWMKAGDPYHYKITMQGIEQGKRQNLNPAQLITFLKRASNDKVPESLISRITVWGKGGSVPGQSVSVGRVALLRTPNADIMTMIVNEPTLRRYLGSQLSPTAAIVREEQWPMFIEALRNQGIQVRTDEKEDTKDDEGR
jgi:hypothetical protein